LLISVNNQVIIFLYSIIAGIIIAFIYDLFRIKRKKIKSRAFVTYLEDFVYWLIVAIIMFSSFYISNDGEMRGYIFFGTIIGLIFYVLFLSKIVITVSMAILNLLTRIFVFVWKVATYPIRIIFRILKVPMRFLFTVARKAFRKTRRVSKVKFSILVIRKRMFKNSRKKI
jgi:spore cortex biosynthesis protein YabQ